MVVLRYLLRYLERTRNHLCLPSEERITMTMGIELLSARELVGEVMKRVGPAEACRQLDVPTVTELCALVERLDRFGPPYH